MSKKDWWEEPWAIPVLAVFGYGLYRVMMDMRAEAQAVQQQQQQRQLSAPQSTVPDWQNEGYAPYQ